MPRQISAFDLDHTLINVNSSYLFGTILYEKKQLSFTKAAYLLGMYALHKARIISIATLHATVFKSLFHGKHISYVQSLLPEFLHRLKPHFNTPVLERLQKAKADGHHVLILSSSPNLLVGAIAESLGVCVWDATHYEVDKDQKFCKITHIMEGESKAKNLILFSAKMRVDLEKITAYSDSSLDLPFMEVAGIPIGVNPDRALRKMCHLYGWEIISS